MLIHSMDCDGGPGAHLSCQKGEPKGTWEDSWKALESLVNQGKGRSQKAHLNGLLSAFGL